MAPRGKTTLLTGLLAGWLLLSVPAADQDRELEKRLKRFQALPVARQEQILDTVKKAIQALDDPYLKAIRIMAWKSRLATKPRIDKFPPKSKSRTGKADFTMPFPITREYVFGVGIIVPVGGLYSPAEIKGVNRKGGRRRPRKKAPPKASKRTTAQRVAELRSWLQGFPPDLDLALATLLYRLDRDSGADRFFAFLESWRNNQESFYQALDRTAGTPDSVFFYDAMLDSFAVNFVPKPPSPYSYLRRSLESLHDALHNSFLAYRQYRAFREALAFSLLLPKEVKLPPVLARYEKVPPTGFCLRQQATILLGVCREDPEAVAAMITNSAPKLPAPLWSKPYDPFPAFHADFARLAPQMIDLAGGTAKLLARQEKRRLERTRLVADTARKELDRLGVR